MIVRLSDGIYLDPTTGVIGDEKLGKAKDVKTVVFYSKVSISRIKPTGRGLIKRKIGDTYVSSTKMSMGYILCCFMLRNGKKKLVGFYPYKENSFIFFDATNEGNKKFTIEYKIIDDYTPESYKELEGKYYDAIFGPTSLANIEIQFDALLKELSKTLVTNEPFKAVVIGVLIMALLGSAYYILSVVTTPAVKPAVKSVVHNAASPPPPLSEAETLRLKQAVSSDLLLAYKQLLGGIGNDRILKKVSMRISSTPMSVDSAMTVTYASYYPFDGSSKNGDLFTWENVVSGTKKREDIASLNSLQDFGKCMETLLDMKDVEFISRKGNDWMFSFKQNNYKGIVTLFNTLFRCPFVIENISFSENESSGAFIMQAERQGK